MTRASDDEHGAEPVSLTEPAHPVDPDTEWRRVSPLTPLLRGGLVVLAVLGYLGSQLFSRVLGSLGGGDSSTPGEDEGVSTAVAHPFFALGAVLLVVGVVVAGAYLSWRFTRYRISDVQVELRRGWLNREHRQVPMNRIQAVEISRPLLAQVLGLAQVVVQSAGGKDSHLNLAFLSLTEATAVRHRIQRLAARSDESPVSAREPSDAGESVAAERDSSSETASVLALPGELFGFGSAEGRLIVKVPNVRLLIATMLHSSVFFLLALLLISATGATIAARYGAVAGVLSALPAVAPIVFGVVVNRISELTKHGNFALSDIGGSVRVVHGLTDHRTTAIPLHRIQAMEMIQPLWWRPMGWWRVHLNVAGVHHETGEGKSADSVLPVGPLPDAVTVLTLIDPQLSPDELQQAALGDGEAGGWVGSPKRAALFDPLSWRRNGYRTSPHAVLIRRGRFSRRVTVVPHARIQSLTVRQGPWATRRHLADVHLISTPGPVSPQIPHLDTSTAERFHRDEMARARDSRRARGTVAKPAQTGVNLGTERTGGVVFPDPTGPDTKDGLQ